MWEAFKDLIFSIIQFFYNICLDWGLAIIIVTIIFRLLMQPIIFSQTKSTYAMKKLQPLVAKLKDKYPDDPARVNSETQRLYAEAKYNPIKGCIPMLIQLPIFMALFQTLRDMGDKIVESGDTYSFFNIVPDLLNTPAEMYSKGFSEFLPYLVLLAIFALLTFVPTLMMSKDQDPQQKKQTYIMVVCMTIMMVWVGWNSPAGVLLFWGVSSLIGVIQQQVSMSILKKNDTEVFEFEEAPVQVEVTRKERRKRPTKSR